MILRTLQLHRANGRTRRPGDVYALDARQARNLLKAGLVTCTERLPDWHGREGRALRAVPLPAPVRPVVACLSIWNDTPALRQTMPSWLPHVDALVVADGPYQETGCTGASTDGLSAVLTSVAIPLHPVAMPGRAWPDQVTKRTALLQQASTLYPDAVLFVVDADEEIANGEALRSLPALDVGWVQVTSNLYQRRYGQPRLFRAALDLHYLKRHHWLMRGETMLATHQYGGAGVLHQLVPVGLTNQRGLGHTEARRKAKQRYQRSQYTREVTHQPTASDAKVGARESLRILQLTTYDPGFVGYRLHTALNATTPHASLLGTDHRHNPWRGATQYDLEADAELLGMAYDECDVLHCHLDYRPPVFIGRSGLRKRWTVIHHHGSLYRQKQRHWNVMDAHRAGLRLVSNLELLRYGSSLRWLPNPMPVAEYRALRAATWQPSDRFRLAHSPTKRNFKGTALLLDAVDWLQRRHVPIDLVLIEQTSHADGLRLKAGCDAVFDAFWLGIQCSGLEGAAMGLPVIAGDDYLRVQYEDRYGAVPYTWCAEDKTALVEILQRMVEDTAWRQAEAQRVAAYCLATHDEATVTLQYLDYLDEAFDWRTALGVKRPLTHVPPEPETPLPRIIRKPEPKQPSVPDRPVPLVRAV